MSGQTPTAPLVEQLRQVLSADDQHHARDFAEVLARIAAGEAGAAALHRFLARFPGHSPHLLYQLGGTTLHTADVEIIFGHGQERGTLLVVEQGSLNSVEIRVRRVIAPRPAPNISSARLRQYAPAALVLLVASLLLAVSMAQPRQPVTLAPWGMVASSVAFSSPGPRPTMAPFVGIQAVPMITPTLHNALTGSMMLVGTPTVPPLLGEASFQVLAPGARVMHAGWEYSFANVAHVRAFPRDLGDSEVHGRLVVLALTVRNTTGRAQPLPADLVVLIQNGTALPFSPTLSRRYSLLGIEAALPLDAEVPTDGLSHPIFLAFDVPETSTNLALISPLNPQSGWRVLARLDE